MSLSSGSPQERSPRRDGRLSLAIFLLVVLTTVSWRRGVYFDGGLDPVVAAKGMLSILALTMAWFARHSAREVRPVGGRTFWLLTAYLVVANIGAYAAGQLTPSAVLSMRLLILVLTVILLMRAFAPERLFRDLLAAMLTVGLVAVMTGLPSYPAQGRLFGGLPPLHPNEIALLLGIPLLGLGWFALQDRLKSRHVVLGAVLLGCIWLTGSRTGLAAVIMALALMLLQARRLNPAVAAGVFASIPIGFYLIFFSEMLTGYVQRGGADNLTTLSSRTIAWSAAWTFSDDNWVRWMGSGLSQKMVPVKGQWWDAQLLDSSWVSALVQAGLLGVIIVVLWLLCVTAASLRCPPPARMFFTALLLFVMLRSTLESGLLDSTPTFLILVLISLTSDSWTRRGWARTEPSLSPEQGQLLSPSS